MFKEPTYGTKDIVGRRLSGPFFTCCGGCRYHAVVVVVERKNKFSTKKKNKLKKLTYGLKDVIQ
jgi:hypothetical protein